MEVLFRVFAPTFALAMLVVVIFGTIFLVRETCYMFLCWWIRRQNARRRTRIALELVNLAYRMASDPQPYHPAMRNELLMKLI